MSVHNNLEHVGLLLFKMRKILLLILTGKKIPPYTDALLLLNSQQGQVRGHKSQWMLSNSLCYNHTCGELKGFI